jgi:hypothetical protein
LQTAVVQGDVGVHPTPVPNWGGLEVNSQSPLLQKPPKQPSWHVTNGGFGKFGARFVHAVRVWLTSQIWQG